MFEQGPDGAPRLTRTWIIFFERLTKMSVEASGGTMGGGGPYIRTLLLKDTTVLHNVADHVPIFVAGTAARLIGVLRITIMADLKVQVNIEPGHIPLGSITIPSATGIDQPITTDAFTTADVAKLGDLAVLSWDVIASDGSADPNGVASITLQWE